MYNFSIISTHLFSHHFFLLFFPFSSELVCEKKLFKVSKNPYQFYDWRSKAINSFFHCSLAKVELNKYHNSAKHIKNSLYPHTTNAPAKWHKEQPTETQLLTKVYTQAVWNKAFESTEATDKQWANRTSRRKGPKHALPTKMKYIHHGKPKKNQLSKVMNKKKYLCCNSTMQTKFSCFLTTLKKVNEKPEFRERKKERTGTTNLLNWLKLMRKSSTVTKFIQPLFFLSLS